MIKLFQLDVIDATFKPMVIKDLKEGAENWIGFRGLWEVLWKIEEEDGGNYVGEFAVGFSHEQMKKFFHFPPFVWVPSCDLRIHKIVKPSPYRYENL